MDKIPQSKGGCNHFSHRAAENISQCSLPERRFKQHEENSLPETIWSSVVMANWWLAGTSPKTVLSPVTAYLHVWPAFLYDGSRTHSYPIPG